MKDQRKYKRFKLNVLEVNGTVMFTKEVKVVDISIDGISLESTKMLTMGNTYVLKLKDRKKAVSLKGSVVWSSLSEAREGPGGDVIPIYKVGMKFTDVSAEKGIEILNFIEANKKDTVRMEGGTRLNIRFHINDPAKAILNLPASFKVKAISLGGMLINSPLDLEIESRIPMELSLQDDNLITFVGRVASCHVTDGDNGKQYDIGIEFSDLSAADKEKLTIFIGYCGALEYRSEGEKAPADVAGESNPACSREFLHKVEHLYKWHKTMGYYKALGVTEYASDRQIRSAFYELAAEFHPDKFPNITDDLKQKIHEIFSYLTVAYSTLIDPQKKKEYNKKPISRIRRI
jgi:hypothetical protein